MCGIAGVLHDDRRAPDPRALEAMAAAMAHRGPDSTGVLCTPHVGLAATRLAILDLSEAGDQPVADDHHALAFNGELYDHVDLRAEVRGAGVQLRGGSDTEVLFHLLRLQGIDAVLPRLRGMFAFAWVEQRTGRVHLVRDRLGIKPLHWIHRDGTQAWASEIKGLRAVLPLTIDPARTIFSVLSLADRWSERTVFEHVHQVAPGHHVVLEPGRTPASTPWYTLATDVDPDLFADLSAAGTTEVRDRLAVLLEHAVRRTSTSDAPVATLVSGGVDSSLIASFAAEAHPAHRLYTAAVTGSHSELPAAEALAEHLHLDLVPAPFTPGDVLDDWTRGTWSNEAPIVTHLNALPLARVAQAVHGDGAKVVLTGEGADELFAGYPSMAARRHLDLARVPYTWLRRLYSTVPGLAEQVLPGGPSPEGYLGALSDDFETARLGREADQAFTHLDPGEARRAVLTYVALQGHLRTLLHRNDRMAMQWSVESRFPYLDEDLVRFGLNLPHRHKVALSARVHDRKHPFVRDKAVLRDVAQARGLSSARRPKAGFPSWGHVHMRVGRGLFVDGWVADQLELSAAAMDHLVEHEDPYHVAKLASVEVFARLFALDHDQDEVRDHIQANVRMDVGDEARADRAAARRPVPWSRWRSPI